MSVIVPTVECEPPESRFWLTITTIWGCASVAIVSNTIDVCQSRTRR